MKYNLAIMLSATFYNNGFLTNMIIILYEHFISARE